MKTKIFMIVLLMSISAVLVAQPQGVTPKKVQKQGQGMQKGMPRDRMQQGMQALNLTDAQKESFKKNMMATQKQLQPLRNELGEAEARQRTLNSAEKPDFGAINKNIDKVAGIRAEMAKVQVKNHLDMRAQLTDEQRMKFDMMKHNKGPKGQKGPKGAKVGKGPRFPDSPRVDRGARGMR
jgi:Spy/CpxP family protein refolding chaperone